MPLRIISVPLHPGIILPSVTAAKILVYSMKSSLHHRYVKCFFVCPPATGLYCYHGSCRVVGCLALTCQFPSVKGFATSFNVMNSTRG